jgi:divinyl chlorophyllide a 8-vinyl-reductase
MSEHKTVARVSPHPRRILMAGGTGTIGRAVVAELVARGHQVICVVRPRAGKPKRTQATSPDAARGIEQLAGAEVRACQVTDPLSLREQGLRNEGFDAVVSCLASRTGEPRDAWAIDHQANLNLLQQGRAAGATQMVLLSAICVQRPRLAFQQAKLAFEAAWRSRG